MHYFKKNILILFSLSTINAEAMSNNGTDDEDYLDRLAQVFPLHRSLTSLERLFIVSIVSIFVSIVGCTLLCLVCPRSPLRRRYATKAVNDKEQSILANAIPRRSILIVPPPPSYESIVKTDNVTDLNKLSNSRYLHVGRKLSNGTMSDGDGVSPNPRIDYLSSINGKILRSQSARSSFSHVGPLATISNTYPLAPYAQIHADLSIDPMDNIVNVHLTNGEHICVHPAFDEQADYFIRMQLINNKLLKKCQEAWKKRRSSVSFNTWTKQQEKTTKQLFRSNNDTLICDEHVQFQFNKNELTLISLRFLLCCTDRSGTQDVMLESVIPLNPSMVPHHQQLVEFKEIPQITFAEIFLGLSYLPTSERFTLTINKLRYFYKPEKKLDARVIVTCFHHGRRFFQKKISCILDGANSNELDINDTMTQNIPVYDIQTVYVHLELSGKDDESIIPATSILLGKHTRYESEWQRILEQPRQTHVGWYAFLG